MARPTPSTSPQSPAQAPTQARARRGSTPAFWVLSGAIVSALVFAVVGLNAMLVDVTYRATDVQERVLALEDVHDELDIEVARLSSPSRIAEWADVVGMVVPGPGESVILRVPGKRVGARSGAGE